MDAMIWDAKALRALSDIVDRKYDAEFRDDAKGWKRYLDEHGIVRRPFQLNKKRSGGNPCVWIECPLSVHNSVPGSLYTKSELFFPMDLAEKIIVLEGMP